MDSQKARDWEIEKTVKELYNWVVKKMKGIKKNYLIILAVVDLIALLAAFIFERYDIFLVLLLTNITLIALVSMVFIFSQLYKGQAVSPEEYYKTILKKEKEHIYFDNNLLSKMFEIRITNRRNSIFTYLVFLLTYTLAIILNSEKICQFSNVLSLLLCRLIIMVCALVGALGIGILVYQSARLDRYAIEELDELFKAMKALEKLNNKSDEESEKACTHD